jgi:hypothetical protein
VQSIRNDSICPAQTAIPAFSILSGCIAGLAMYRLAIGVHIGCSDAWDALQTSRQFYRLIWIHGRQTDCQISRDRPMLGNVVLDNAIFAGR